MTCFAANWTSATTEFLSIVVIGCRAGMWYSCITPTASAWVCLPHLHHLPPHQRSTMQSSSPTLYIIVAKIAISITITICPMIDLYLYNPFCFHTLMLFSPFICTIFITHHPILWTLTVAASSFGMVDINTFIWHFHSSFWVSCSLGHCIAIVVHQEIKLICHWHNHITNSCSCGHILYLAMGYDGSWSGVSGPLLCLCAQH